VKDLLEALADLLKEVGLPLKLSKVLTISLFSGLVGVALSKLIYELACKIILMRNQHLLNKDLSPYYSKSDVIRATQYYIPSRYQNVSPSEDEEPGRKYIASAKAKLLPLFLKKVFLMDGNDNKFYLILADTGMGKTTFLLNLYLKYKNRLRLFRQKSLEMYLIPLGADDADKRILNIENPANVILLLDAFDEDVNAVDRHRERMTEILKIAKNFKYLIITCRTQFFPTEEEEPYRTGYYTFGDYSREYSFQKIYLSVFDNRDIKAYLKKRFLFRFNPKYQKAQKIVDKSPNLVVRPLLLSHINELIESKKAFQYSYEVYDALIERWIIREANKPGILERFGSSENYQQLLYSFSRAMAYDLYINRDKRGGYYISKDEKLNTGGLDIADIESDNKMSDSEKKSKSLLNRNSRGQYKFSHKSIFEFFLAQQLIDDIDFLWSFHFNGMQAAYKFLCEMSTSRLSGIEGSYWTSQGKPKTLSTLTLPDLKKTSCIFILNIDGFNFNYVMGCERLKSLFLLDQRFKLLNELILLMAFNFTVKNFKVQFNRLLTTSTLYHYSSVYEENIKTMEFIDTICKKAARLNYIKEPFDLESQYDVFDLNNYRWLQYFLLHTIVAKLHKKQYYYFEDTDVMLLEEESYHSISRALDTIDVSYKGHDRDLHNDGVSGAEPEIDQKNFVTDYSLFAENKSLTQLLQIWISRAIEEHGLERIKEQLSFCDLIARKAILLADLRPDISLYFAVEDSSYQPPIVEVLVPQASRPTLV
jgi:hypothetical protein